MKFKGPMTAAELMAKLEADPEFQKRRAEKDRRFAEHAARLEEAKQPILEDLRRIGVETTSIEEVTKRYTPLPAPIVEVLLKWLPSAGHDRVKESVIRALGAARDPFDGQPLDVNGNVLPTKKSPAAHIPLPDFRFAPGVFQ